MCAKAAVISKSVAWSRPFTKSSKSWAFPRYSKFSRRARTPCKSSAKSQGRRPSHMESVERTFQLHVPSSTENLSMIREFVVGIGQSAGFSDSEVAKLVLAVDEACANVIEHAYGSDTTREVTVKATM